MGVESRTFSGRYGLHYIKVAELAFVTILSVKRVGVGYTQKSTEPTESERKFSYDSSEGGIYFSPDQVFGLDSAENNVFVMWKT